MTFDSSETAAKALSAAPDALVLDGRTLRLAPADTPKRGVPREPRGRAKVTDGSLLTVNWGNS